MGVGVIVVFFGVAYDLYGLFRHCELRQQCFRSWHLRSVVWHLSRFEPPGSSIYGFSNFLGDHFFPVIALFAPLYWIRPGAETLIVAQAVLFAASIVPVFAFMRSRISDRACLVPGDRIRLLLGHPARDGLRRP